MSSPYVKLGDRTLDQWKVTELKEELKRRKLTTSGLKQDLVRRLDEAVRLEMESSSDNAEDDATESEEPIEKINAETNGMEGGKVPAQSVAENTAVNDSIEPVKPLGESNPQNHESNEDGASTSVLINDGHPQDDAKHELSAPIIQSPHISESGTYVESLNEQGLQANETQNEAIHSTEQRENDDLKYDQPDQPLKHQVSEIDPNLGFQVTSDSVSTESVSVIEKNELKIDVIDDNNKLELDVKPEMQQSPGGAAPDGGELHKMDVGEPLEQKEAEETHDKNLQVETIGGKLENAEGLKSIDSGDIGAPEKLSLDRSSGDDSMEEDVMESKLMDDEKSGSHSMKEEDHVDVVGHDKHVETVSTMNSGKRKFLDKEAVGDNDAVKKVCRWNVEGLKSSEPQSGSITPRGSSVPSFKPIPETNSAASVEAPTESVVPPSSRAPTNSLRIDNFLRPFTLKAVQELLGKTGTVTSFWMDHIKTHCYVSYTSVEEAEQTRNAVYNLQWPPNGGRLLVADFVDPLEVKSRVEAPLPSPATPSSTTPTQTPTAAQPSQRKQVSKQQIPPPLPPPPLSNPPHVRERLHPPREQALPARDRLNLPPPPPLPEKIEPPIVTLDDLFRKTKATPRIYYLPLSDELVAEKLKTQGKNVTQ